MDNVALDENTLKTLIEYGKQLATPGAPITGEKVHYAILPKGDGRFEITSLKEFQFPYGMPPERIIANPTFQDAVSFCHYLKDYADDRLRVFADTESARFNAILDYHGPEDPDYCKHTATFQMKDSPQWKTWLGMHDKLIPQDAFAEFLEDNYRDISSPSPAVMLEVARDLKVHSEVVFESKITPKTGQVQLVWQENMKTAGTMDVPDMFSISIPVFFGEPLMTIDCRLRFRIRDGKLSFIYKMYRPAETRLEAFKAAVISVGAELERQVHLGMAG